MLIRTVLIICIISYCDSINTSSIVPNLNDNSTRISLAELNTTTKVNTTNFSTLNTTSNLNETTIIKLNTTINANNDTEANKTNTKFICEGIHDCEQCLSQHCFWINCFTDHTCSEEVPEFCENIGCTTTTDSPTTTAVPPSTTTTQTSTTPASTTTTPASTTTTSASTTMTPATNTTDDPSTTISTSSESTTSSSSTEPIPTTTEPAKTHPRQFDGASFIGGMIFAILFGALAYGGWIFYKKKILTHTYSNF